MSQTERPKTRIDFSYAFATPHRVTAGRPDHSDRTLLDLQPGSLRMAWTFDDLRGYPPAAFRTPPTLWSINVVPTVEGHPFAGSAWTRSEGWLPSVINTYTDPSGTLSIEAVGAADSLVARVEIHNSGDKPAHFRIRLDSGAWGENPAWMQPERFGADHLLAGWNERADRILVLGIGADSYTDRADGLSPGAKTVQMDWQLAPGATRTGWIIRPYASFADEVEHLRRRDWSAQMEAGKAEWRALVARAAQVHVPDPVVESAFKACLADQFVMREPAAGGDIASVPGTECYRAANTHEAAISAIAIDQLGLHAEAELGYRLPLKLQSADGNWNDAQGWGHTMWSCAGFKSWAVMTHYRLTHDRRYLSKIYPRMLASSRWQAKERARTRVMVDGQKPIGYGLMPRGFGDCGLMNDDDMYGIFLPHNLWSVYADRVAMEAAQVVGTHAEAEELRGIYEAGLADLMVAMERGAITEGDHRWLPGVPGKTSGSLWGGLNALFPCGLLAPDHGLVTGTLKHMESRLSPGGIPIHTGWMPNGMWVAITLDNLAETHLRLGNGDAAARYFRATLNHGTPLFTWCEERGQEPNTAECTGDRQHNWTPIAVTRCLRDMLVMEQGETLHLALGADREWLASGRPLGITGSATEFGKVGYTLRLDPETQVVTGEVELSERRGPDRMVVHLRLPDGRKVTAVDAASKGVVTSGETVEWTHPRGRIRFTANLK